MAVWLRRQRIVAALVAVLLFATGLSGCTAAAPSSNPGSPTGSPTKSAGPGSSSPSSAIYHQEAQADLARWDDAVAKAAGPSAFVPVGDLTGQVGDWEEAVGNNNKPALMSGLVNAAVALPADTPPDGQLHWHDGGSTTVRLISAQQALTDLQADGAGLGGCPDCVPLEITGAQLTTGTIATSRGPADVPVWEFTLQGTTVRITRVAAADRVTVVPPDWDPYNAPIGISIDSATGTVDGRELTVTFVGAPDTGDKPCGSDYTAEAVESANAVVVIVTEHPYTGTYPQNWGCADVGARRTAVAELAKPLGGRAVLEVKQGLPVTVHLNP
jgi:hypothetical protein